MPRRVTQASTVSTRAHLLPSAPLIEKMQIELRELKASVITEAVETNNIGQLLDSLLERRSEHA